MQKTQSLLVVLIVALTAGFSGVSGVGSATFGAFKSKESESSGMRSLVLVGDVMLARKVEYFMNQHGPTYPFTRLDPFRSDALVVGNFESAMTEVHRPTPFYTFTFRTKPEYAAALRDIGFTHLGLANNHSHDAGEPGYQYTAQSLDAAGFAVFGHPKSLATSSVSVVNVQGFDIALIGIHAVEREPTEEELRVTFEYASSMSEFQVVYVHWGSEYALTHNDFQERLAKRLVASGADLVVGHHPHVVQDVALIEDVLVFYSLGNFIFDQYFSSDVQEGLMLEVSPSNGRLAVRLKPVVSADMQSAPRPMDDKESEMFLRKLAQRSSYDLRAELEAGSIDVQYVLANGEKITSIRPY